MTEMIVIDNYVNTGEVEFPFWWPSSSTKGSLEKFLGNIQGNTPCLIHGGINRFKGLIDWNQINQLLNTNRLDYPQLRFTKDGESVPEFRYTTTRHSTARGTVTKEPIPSKVHELLREGTSMTIDGIDKMVPQIGKVARSIERTLGEEVNANMYCAFQGSRGFPVHWDAHDVYIIQIAGSKAWKVYRGGRKHPLDRDVAHASEAPEGILWEGKLDGGDVLYLPRGTWHEATTEDDFSLHVTFGCSHSTGIDFLNWIVDKLRSEEELRKDIITALQEKPTADYATLLQEKVLHLISKEQVEDFLEYRSTRSVARNQSQLPYAVYEEVQLTEMDTFEFCTSQLCIDDSSLSEKIILLTGGKSFKFPRELEELVSYLVKTHPEQFTFSDLLSVAKSNISSYSVNTVLSRLIQEGVLRKIHLT